MTREAQKLIFADGEIPTGANYSDLIDQIPLIVPLISDLPTAAAGNLGQVYCVGGINYKCTNPSTGVYEWTNMNAAAAANDYANASNKPKINGIVLNGDKTASELKLALDNSNRSIQSVIDKNDKIQINDDKYITVGDLQRSNVGYNFVKKETQFFLKDIELVANVDYEIDVFENTGLYMAHKEAFFVAVFASGVQIPVTVTSNDLGSFYVKHTSNVTANIFVSFMDINWDYEGVMQNKNIQIGPSTNIYGFAELWQNNAFDVNWGIIYPSLNRCSSHKYGTTKANSFFKTLLYFVSGSTFTYYGVTYTANTIEVGGNVQSVMVGSNLFDSIVSYNSTYNYTILTAASNPFQLVGSGEIGTEINIKIKYN